MKWLCRFGIHKYRMFGGGYTDVRCVWCGRWWDELDEEFKERKGK